MKKVEYKVTGMTCGGCAASITRVLTRNKAISDVEVEQWENKVFVTYDQDKMNDKDIMNLIERLGYKASLAHENSSI